MKIKILQAVAFLLVLASCAVQPPGPGGVPFNPENPRVYVVEGKQIVVDQEPIFIARGRKDVTIVWELPRDQKLAFPSDGIAIREGRDEFSCGLERDATRFACKFRNSKPGAVYKYTIKVRLDGKDLRALDPSLISDF